MNNFGEFSLGFRDIPSHGRELPKETMKRELGSPEHRRHRGSVVGVVPSATRLLDVTIPVAGIRRNNDDADDYRRRNGRPLSEMRVDDEFERLGQVPPELEFTKVLFDRQVAQVFVDGEVASFCGNVVDHVVLYLGRGQGEAKDGVATLEVVVDDDGVVWTRELDLFDV